ncbi:MAG: ABC transporter permease subunit, partial [Gammaproteobacteria bacterium]|nr:ABC transporter permease subunit [Gammaproteobacteria bacterium]
EILVLLLFYFGSAITLTWIWQLFDPGVKFVDFPPFWAGSFAIALIIGSYATETFRGAFLGVDPGQTATSRALGLSNLQPFISARIPAMWRLALPPFGNHMLSLTKDTALVAIIGLEETLFVAEQAIGYTAKPFTMYILVGAIYLGFSTIITLTVMALEKYANRHLQVSQ